MILNIFKSDKNFASGDKRAEKELVEKLMKEWKEKKEKEKEEILFLDDPHFRRKRKEKQE